MNFLKWFIHLLELLCWQFILNHTFRCILLLDIKYLWLYKFRKYISTKCISLFSSVGTLKYSLTTCFGYFLRINSSCWCFFFFFGFRKPVYLVKLTNTDLGYVLNLPKLQVTWVSVWHFLLVWVILLPLDNVKWYFWDAQSAGNCITDDPKKSLLEKKYVLWCYTTVIKSHKRKYY